MAKIEGIETLAFLGGIGAILSPIAILFGLGPLLRFYPAISFYPFPFFTLITVIFGFIGGILAIRSVRYVDKMPHRAAQDLQTTGILLVVMGFLSLLNWVLLLSGTLVLIAGIECNALKKKIQQARNQTGWPYVTVATAAGDRWARRLSCRYCGAPLVVLSANAKGPWIRLKTLCPLDATNERMRLPLARLEEWTAILADRLHRCVKCGDRTAALLTVGQNGLMTRLQAYCPKGHSNRIYRMVWTPLYPHVATTPTVDVGFYGGEGVRRILPSVDFRHTQPIEPRYAGVYTNDTYQPSASTQPIPLSPRSTNTIQAPIAYCHNCGVRVESTDRFCFRCGSQIR